MKRVIFMFVVVFLVIVGCTMNPQPSGNTSSEKFGDYRIKVIDSCEYVEYDHGIFEDRVYAITHKGNCKFCKERNKK